MNEVNALIGFREQRRSAPLFAAARAGGFASLAVAAAFVALWLVRSNVDFADPKFYGEDFPIFWAQYFRDGAEAFFRPYAGYIHLVPRIAGFAAWLLPAVWAPKVFLTVYALALGACAFVALRHSAMLGGLVVAATLAAPNTGEVFASITYFQWVAAAFLAVLYLAPLHGRRIDRLLRLAMLALLGLTGPFAVFLAPFALVEAATLRTRARAPEARGRLAIDAVILVAAALQALTYVLFNDKWAPEVAEPHFLQPLADGIRQTFSVLGQGEFGPVGVGAVVLMATLAAAIALPEHRLKKIILAGFGAGVALAAIYRFRYEPEGLGLAEFGTRYFFVPIVSALVILGLTMATSRRGFLLCLPAAVLIALSYDYAGWRGPQRTDVDWRAQVEMMRRDGWSMIFVNPFWRFVHFREGGRSGLWWNPLTALPKDRGILGPLAFPPGARLVIEGEQSADEACGVAIPMIWMGPETAATDGVFSVRFTSTGADGVVREQTFEFPVAELSNWETMDVGAAPPGPQKVRVEISLAANEDPGVGFPTFAEAPDPVWDARAHLPAGTVLEFEPVVARMRCAENGPFGDLN